MKQVITILIVLILGVGGTYFYLNQPQNMGSESYDGVTQATTTVTTTVQANIASTTNEIFPSNSSFEYRHFDVITGSVFVLFDNATTALSSSTSNTTLLQLDAGDSYTIKFDSNGQIVEGIPYTGRIMGVASGTVLIRTIQK